MAVSFIRHLKRKRVETPLLANSVAMDTEDQWYIILSN